MYIGSRSPDRNDTWIHIHLHPRCVRHRHLRQPGPQDRLHRHIPPRLQQELPAVPPAQHGQRRRCRPQYLHALGPRCRAPKLARQLASAATALVRRDDQRRQSPIGRPMARPPLRRLARHERREVALDQSLHHRVLGRKGLQEHQPGSLRPPGAPRHLMQQLNRPFRPPRKAAGEPQVGVDHADQREMREMPAFRDDLRADDQVHSRARWPARPAAACGQASCRSPSPAGAPGGEKRRRLLGDAFHARADRHEAGRRLAGRTFFGEPTVWPQWWQFSRASRGARPARRCRSDMHAVPACRHSVRAHSRDDLGTASPARRAPWFTTPSISGGEKRARSGGSPACRSGHHGHRRPAMPGRQGQGPDRPASTFARVSRPGVADTSTRAASRAGAQHRHVAGVIHHALFLLERGSCSSSTMIRSSRRTAGTAPSVRPPRPGLRPPPTAKLPAARAIRSNARLPAARQSGARNARETAPRARSPATAPAPGRPGADFRHRLQIHLGLAGPRHAIEQRHREAARAVSGVAQHRRGPAV